MILSAKPTRKRVIAEVIVLIALVIFGIVIDQYVTDIVFHHIVVTIIIAGTLGSWLFIVYFSRSNWRAASATRALMKMGLSLALLFTQVMSSWYWEDYRGQTVTRIFVYSFVTYSIWQMLATLRKEQKRATFRRKQTEIYQNRRGVK